MTDPAPESPFAGLSDGDLRDQIAAVHSELAARDQETTTRRAQRLRAEISEIETGSRRIQPEHVDAVDHHTVSRWAAEGRLAHFGIGAQRKNRR